MPASCRILAVVGAEDVVAVGDVLLAGKGGRSKNSSVAMVLIATPVNKPILPCSILMQY